jgi:hypothetical protein
VRGLPRSLQRSAPPVPEFLEFAVQRFEKLGCCKK